MKIYTAKSCKAQLWTRKGGHIVCHVVKNVTYISLGSLSVIHLKQSLKEKKQ